MEAGYDRFFGEGAFEKINGKNVFEGDSFKIDGIRTDILMTVTEKENQEKIVNDSSLILRMTIEGQTVLFLGDAYYPEGERLLSKYGDALKSDIVQIWG